MGHGIGDILSVTCGGGGVSGDGVSGDGVSGVDLVALGHGLGCLWVGLVGV